MDLPDAEALARARARFAPTPLTVDLSPFPDYERQALALLVQAARVMDAIYLRQVWAGNVGLLAHLASDESALGRERLRALLLYKGPWSRLDHDAPFVPGVPAKPKGAGFYPEDATKAELEAWLAKLPEAERQAALGYFSVVQRGPGGLEVVPYSRAYAGELAEASRLLRAAAAKTRMPSVQQFLEARAQAFLDDQYRDSDVAWMQLDDAVEPTIGPYEVYEDGLFSAKAAFEAYVAIRDDAETQKLEHLSGALQTIEDHLPIAPALRNPKLGALAPIKVVNELFCAGDADHGVQTAAFNLPNDEWVTAHHGAKRVMLKNVQQAKFEKVLLPIAKAALSAEDQGRVSFEAFFTHIVMHELMHGLGPHQVAGSQRPVREAMQEVHSALEEAKADISGLFALQFLVDRGLLSRELERTMYVTFLASAFRSIRFGLNEAHGLGQALQLNWLLDAGAFRVGPGGTFAVDEAKVREAVAQLTGEVMTLQASGDGAQARAWFAKLGVIRPEVQALFDRLSGVPVDIRPEFVTARELLGA